MKDYKKNYKKNYKNYDDFLSPAFRSFLLQTPEARDVEGIPGLVEIGVGGGLENRDSLSFLCELYREVEDELALVLKRRAADRKFIDERTISCLQFNDDLKREYRDHRYQTVLGLEDANGRVVVGPLKAKTDQVDENSYAPVAPLPDFLSGPHVTLFGPPDNAKLSINAMNAYHRRLQNEPPIVEELLLTHESLPKWGADDEDSKTPLRADLIAAGENLAGCLEKTLSVEDEITKRKYELQKEKLSLPIKRFPGLALPCTFLFYEGRPVPLHLYDLALHLFRHWANPQALVFYVPKLENEEEARYVRIMLRAAERLLQQRHPSYRPGTIRLLIVLENPRAIFRIHEIMDELHPYFAGASLGWHDFLASTARLMKNDPHYRIPVKADPHIVIKYIKASHDLLASEMGKRGGIKVGGMYGVLPTSTDLKSPSFQVTIKGFIKDVITQLRRNLTGFWVAHPDFVRIGLALVEAWKFWQQGNQEKLLALVRSLLQEEFHQEMVEFILKKDVEGLDPLHPLYPRSLIVADLEPGQNIIANNDPEEIRYNVFQSLQYLTDWLGGNGCVALPAVIEGEQVRVMDDLATAERSRWEVWHEICHGRFPMEHYLQIVQEEMNFIRKFIAFPDSSSSSPLQRMVQVHWDERTEKWYPVAMKIMIRLMTDPDPVEFATELLLPFTLEEVRKASDPWARVKKIDPEKYRMDAYIERFLYYFEMCGHTSFAVQMANNVVLDISQAKKIISQFDQSDIIAAAQFHGNIGESRRTLDAMARTEQALVFPEEEKIKGELRELGRHYLEKFGMKFLISAKGKTGAEMLAALKQRLTHTLEVELEQARRSLLEITCKRMLEHPLDNLKEQIQHLLEKHQISGATMAVVDRPGMIPGQSLHWGKVDASTWFQVASLSKPVAAAFAMEFFRQRQIPLTARVNGLLEKTSSTFRLKGREGTNWADQVTVADLMRHSALNMHYVKGIPAGQKMPPVRDLLEGNKAYGYEPIEVINPPGEVFRYSGGGYLVLEHLIESLAGKPVLELTRSFLDELDMADFSFDPQAGSPDSQLKFPSFAAGAWGTAASQLRFLQHLSRAYHELEGSGPISHDTAVEMLHGTDKGCRNFMGTDMGMGIFVAEAGENRLMIHQGANEGYRCLFIHGHAGPDRGKGIVLLCQGDFNGVLFNAEVAQLMLKHLRMTGIETGKFHTDFKVQNIKPEEIVNKGYKDLLFGALKADLPEEIREKGPLDPLSQYNLAVGEGIISVSNQRFARAENLLSPYRPVFDPELFGKQGKIMDSWESARHNQSEFDELVFELRKPSPIDTVTLSTQFHLGNQAQYVQIWGMVKVENQAQAVQEVSPWKVLLPKTRLEGHAFKCIKLTREDVVYSRIKVWMYPDGGLTRLGLFDGHDLGTIAGLELKEKSYIFEEKIPIPHRPLSLPYWPTEEEIRSNIQALKNESEVNVASAALGAKVLKASNEHYGPAMQVISPFGPVHMFDGLESARSRQQDHQEEVIIKLAWPASIHRIEMDFTFFVNNNPLYVSVLGLASGQSQWTEIVSKTKVKAFAGNTKSFTIAGENSRSFEQVKVVTFPDGGINRIRVMSRSMA